MSTSQTPSPETSMPPPRRQRWATAWRASLLVIGSLGLTLLGVETTLVLVGYEYVPVSIQAAGQADFREFHVFEDRNFAYDPELIWRPRPGQSVFNSQGFRGPELPAAKPAGTVRIFAVGDSNTLGWAGEDGPNWPHELGLLTRSVREGVVVVNAGVWGYASHQGVVRFRETLAFDPDLVLISFGGNDGHRVLRSDREYAESPWRETSLHRTRLGQLIVSTLDRRSSAAAQLKPRVSEDDYRANLAEIIREGRARGVQVVLLTRPYIGPLAGPFQWKRWAHHYNAATVDTAQHLGVPVIDLYSYFKGRDELFADESHFTAEGHRLAAKVVLDHLRSLLSGAAPPAP